MSHSGNVTVSETNITIYENSVNAGMQELGLNPIKPGTPVPVLTQTALRQMTAKIPQVYTADFPNAPALPPGQVDSGFFGPLDHVAPGETVPSVVSQIHGDFSNWGLPTTDTSLFDSMAKEIVEEVVMQGGTAGFGSGTKQITSSVSVYWVVGYATINITQDELGVLYVFAAQAGLAL